jgi:hypothetical protein
MPVVPRTDNTIALLNEVAEFLEGQADVRDGSDGPRPNKAMELMARAEIEIERLKRASLSGPSQQGLKSRPLYAPARSIAQDGKEHLYVFHNGLWYHFSPKGWEAPSPTATPQHTKEDV